MEVLLLFTAVYRGKTLQLCFGRQFHPVDKPHLTGMQVLKPVIDTYSGCFIVDMRAIERSLLVIPDFEISVSDEHNFSRYLVNHDLDEDCWRRFEPLLPRIPTEAYVGWSRTEANRDEDSVEGMDA